MTANATPMLEQVYSLPQMIQSCLSSFATAAELTLTPGLCRSLQRLVVVGCGDSHMAAVGAELAFHTVAGIPVQAQTALQFSRYTVPFLAEPSATAVIGISVSGEVARTVEALHLARKAGAVAIALTGAVESRVARVAEHVLKTTLPPLPTAMPTPGVRSYIASLLMLYLAAIRLGEVRGLLTPAAAASLRGELEAVPQDMSATLEASAPTAQRLAVNADQACGYVFVGGGPNYGSALFCAAKLLEASGEFALGQDVEEWSHLQYFGREAAVPTFIIDAGGRSTSRACEVAVAAKRIGRRVVAVVPAGEKAITGQAEAVMPVHGNVREAFSPLLYGLGGMLLADARAEFLGESYYRGFGGGRSIQGGGGISRIQTSDIQEEIEP